MTNTVTIAPPQQQQNNIVTLEDLYYERKDNEQYYNDYITNLTSNNITYDKTYNIYDDRSTGNKSNVLLDYTKMLKNAQDKFLTSQLDINSRFFDRCTPILQDNIISEFKYNYNKHMLLRTDHDIIRGVLSDKYDIINHSEVIQSLLYVLKDKSYFLNKYYIHNGILNIRILMHPMIDNEGYGLSIINSELGESSYKIEPFIFRLVCSNGLIAPQTTKKMRVIHKRSKSRNNLRSITDNLVNDNLNAVKNTFTRYINTKKYIIYDTQKEIKKIVNMLKLPEKYVDVFSDAYTQEPLNTGYGMIQTVTRAAKQYNLEQRIKLETLASKLISVYN